MSRQLRVGIVGCGRILNAHLNGYKALLGAGISDVIITDLCSRQEEDAYRFVAPGGPPPLPRGSADDGDPLNAPQVYLNHLFPDQHVRVWTDAARMIDEADIDVVDITTSVLAHSSIATHAASRAKHVMVEKPMAASVAAAHDMVEQAARAGTVLAVMENVRYEAQVLLGHWLVERGYLGRVEMAAAAYLGSWWSPDAIVAHTAWRHRRAEAGAGISFDLGVHFFQQLRWVCGPIARVYGTVRTFEPVRYRRSDDGSVVQRVDADADDTMFCQVEFENGAVGHVSASWAAHGVATELPGGFAVYGSKGCLRGEELYLDGQGVIALADFFATHASDAEKAALFPFGMHDSFALAYLDFFRAIREGKTPPYDGVEGLTDLAWAAAVLASSLERVPMTAQELIRRRSDFAAGL